MPHELSLIIAACKKGKQQAQLQLYDLYCDAMFTIACRYLKNEEDAKDAMQDGFLKAYSKLETYNATATFGAWLKTIIINQCIDYLKKHRLEFVPLDNENVIVLDDNDWTVDHPISQSHILKVIQDLPQKYAVVLQLYLIEGYDHLEISEILDIPVKTSRTHLYRGRTQLKNRLEEQYYETGYSKNTRR